MSTLMIHAWAVFKRGSDYYLPYSHWIYLREIVKYYDKVILLSPVIGMDDFKKNENSFLSINDVSSVSVYELPGAGSYISAVKHFFDYLRAYRSLSKVVDVSYVRVPAPFGWLQRVFVEKKRIIHFVGDSLDTVLKNRKFSTFRKLLYVCLFYPEYLMTIWGSRRADKVFCNGTHLAVKLGKYGVIAQSLTSSTLMDADFYFDERKAIHSDAPRLIYVGYLRRAKGIETVLQAFKLLQKKLPKASLAIVGAGEEEVALRAMVLAEGIENVLFHGHIDSRVALNEILRKSDIFCFASLSEGSPRVVLEAMANGVNVVSTPVGSLPNTFSGGEEITYAEYGDAEDFYKKIIWLLESPDNAFRIRAAANQKVRGMTLEGFIREIFYEG